MVYRMQNHRDEIPVQVDDSAVRWRDPPTVLGLMPEASPCQPQAAHIKPACLSTEEGGVVHNFGSFIGPFASRYAGIRRWAARGGWTASCSVSRRPFP